MKSIPRFKIPKGDVDSYDDITVSKSGRITITGETLELLERLASEAGMSPGEFLNQRLREDLQDPAWLENILREQIRDCLRVMSWCDRWNYRRQQL